jgi:hypothetical protein
MARKNRVTPFAEIVATPERGTFMGNRGLLHDEEGRIQRAWRLKRWLVCVLEFRGRKRTIMTPNRYTELFFLDEATALAAGHRPCAECRHARYIAFRNAWQMANGGAERPTANEIDDRLHAERLTPDGSKKFFTEALDQLPDGVFITLHGCAGEPCMVWGGHLLAWSPGGYKERRDHANSEMVVVLTPRPTVQAIRAGYVPNVHPSAGLTK